MMPNDSLPLSLPSDFNVDFESHGIFATLTPSNLAAARALSNLVDAIVKYPAPTHLQWPLCTRMALCDVARNISL